MQVKFVECRMAAKLLNKILDRFGGKRMLPRTAFALQKARVNQDGVSTNCGNLKEEVAATVRGAEALLDWSVRRGGFLCCGE